MSRQARARELLLAMLLVVLKVVSAAVEVIILVILLKFPKFRSGSGAGDDFLDPYRVEHDDKGSLFGLETTTNR